MLYQSLFAYPTAPHRFRHGPTGYGDHTSYKEWLRDEFQFRCAYCLRREVWEGGTQHFDVEHAVPEAQDDSLALEYTNLRYVCHRCNLVRGVRPILDPCLVALGQHLVVRDDGRIEGLTVEGTEHIRGMKLGNPALTRLRANHIAIAKHLESAATQEALALLCNLFGYPGDLPDLASLRPPGNSRPEGTHHSYYEPKRRGELPDYY